MKMTLKCPNCLTDSPYVEDELTEEIGGCAFDCPKCGEKFLAPKENPDIKKVEE